MNFLIGEATPPVEWNNNLLFHSVLMFPLTHFSVLWPPYITAPQTIIETSLFLGGQTRYGASFSSSRLQQYILESLPIITEHSSEKLKFFQVSNAQFLRAFAHLIRNSLLFCPNHHRFPYSSPDVLQLHQLLIYCCL